MSRPDYDIVIVGGGPAGAVAGWRLGGSGAKVLLLDRFAFPREKPCGGGISARLYQRFPALREELKTIPVNAVDKVYLESPDGNSLLEERDEPLYLMIRRWEFDALLLGLARRGGIEIREGLRVTRFERSNGSSRLLLENGETIAASLVIGADGVNSVVAKDSGLNLGWSPEQVAIDMMEETPYAALSVRDARTMYVYYGIQGLHGYGYIFPKAEHLNLGMGILCSSFSAQAEGTPYEGHRRFVAAARKTGIVRGESCRGNFRGFRIPVGGALPKTYGEGVLLCGDAAGFVNAFTGEGIYFAMASGEHAAATALEALRKRDFGAAALSGYQRRWSAEFGPELEQSVTVQKILFEDGARINAIVRYAKEDRRLRRLLTDYATGQVDFKSVKRRLLTRFLPFYLRHKLGKFGRRITAALR